ncbi:TPA: hypothetical protein ACNABU_002899 [Citrobacter amalonaticus]
MIATYKHLQGQLEAEQRRNPVLAYADSYRDMAKQGVESIPVWSVITDLERNIAPLYAAPPAPTVTFYRDGIEAAAAWVDQQRESYDSEHGRHDPGTGTFEFGNDAQRDYSATLEEIAEGIRALHPNTAPPAPYNKQTEELVMWVKRLAHSLRKANPDSKLQNDAMDYLSRKGLISVEDVLR